MADLTAALLAALPCEWLYPFPDPCRDDHETMVLCEPCRTRRFLATLDAPTRLAVAKALAPEVWEALEAELTSPTLAVATGASRALLDKTRNPTQEVTITRQALLIALVAVEAQKAEQVIRAALAGGASCLDCDMNPGCCDTHDTGGAS